MKSVRGIYLHQRYKKEVFRENLSCFGRLNEIMRKTWAAYFGRFLTTEALDGSGISIVSGRYPLISSRLENHFHSS